MTSCLHDSIDPTSGMCRDCSELLYDNEKPIPKKIKFPKRMMSQKRIQNWYVGLKADYDQYSEDYEMPEGDFNMLEAEYQVLRTVLGYRDWL